MNNTWAAPPGTEHVIAAVRANLPTRVAALLHDNAINPIDVVHTDPGDVSAAIDHLERCTAALDEARSCLESAMENLPALTALAREDTQ